jgi:hypothetical protein
MGMGNSANARCPKLVSHAITNAIETSARRIGGAKWNLSISGEDIMGK